MNNTDRRFASKGVLVMLGVIATVASVSLVLLPGIQVAGMSVWLYLIPGLLAVHLLPLEMLSGLILLATAVVLSVFGLDFGMLLAEGIASGLFVISLSAWRRFVAHQGSLLLAVNLLFWVFYPLLVWLHHQWSDQPLNQSLLNGSRYVLSTLICVVLAEIAVVLISLSRPGWLGSVRKALNYRPTLVQVVELVIGIAVTSSLVLTLSMYWRSWELSLADVLRNTADHQFESLFVTAQSSVFEKMRMVSKWTKLADASNATLTEEQASHALASLLGADLLRGLEGWAILYPEDAVLLSHTLESSTAQRVALLAQLQRANGLVSLDVRLTSQSKYPALVALSDGLPACVLVFKSTEAIHDFVFSDALASFVAEKSDLGAEIQYSESLGVGSALPSGSEALTQGSGWVVWQRADSNVRYRHTFNAIDQSTRITLSPSAALVDKFAQSLPQVWQFRLETRFMPFFERYASTVILGTSVGLLVLVVLMWIARLGVGKLVQPLAGLTAVFENWRNVKGGELGSGAALRAMDPTTFSALDDIHSLQIGFRSLAQDVMQGERRLSTIAANYDELLRSLPLGVLAVDGSSRVQFLNDALGEMTEHRQDVIARLKAQAASMLNANVTVDEWQLTLDDRPPKTLLLVVNHRLDDRGQQSGLWVIATDMTEQKQTNAQLIQASKLATLGEMSTGMAHELNQPLNVISLATSNLRFSLKKGKATPENTAAKLDRIDAAVHRAASIIDHMRAYGRLASEGLTRIDVADVVGGACNLLAEQLKLANIDLVNRVREEVLWVKGNAIQLEQVLINLINNARDAIRETDTEGRITVEAEVSGARVLLRVSDTGGGIPEHVLPHIFEPFFTTKPVGKGTGLGGSISYGIVREMQGDIWAENVKHGAQITVSLPLMDEEAL